MFEGYNLLKYLMEENPSLKQLIASGMKKEKIRFFNDEEWEKIKNQNFVGYTDEIEDFYDLFNKGYNIGNCVGTSRQLSYSYNDVDIVIGKLPLLKGTKNAPSEGGHGWLETKDSIIDTSLLLVIDKSLKNKFGYIEEMRKTASQLKKDELYQMRKEFVNEKRRQIKK